MWDVAGTTIGLDSLGTFEIVEMIDEGGEPLVFTCLDPSGGMLLVYYLAEEADLYRYLAVVTEQRTVDRLQGGQIDIVTALEQPRAWIVDIKVSWEVQGVWLTSYGDVPAEALPRRGVMLRPEFAPMLSLRLVGDQLGEGKTTASSLRLAAESAEDSMKRIAEIVFNQDRVRGRSSGDVRRFSDLPLQTLRDASLEVSFSRPPIDGADSQTADDQVLDRMGILLRAAIFFSNGSEQALKEQNLNANQQASLLEAVKKLTPPSGVKETFVSGFLVGGGAHAQRLTSKSRRTINLGLKSLVEENSPGTRRRYVYNAIGYISEADRLTNSYTLRNFSLVQALSEQPAAVLADKSELIIFYEDGFEGTVVEAFSDGREVEVWALMQPDGTSDTIELDFFDLDKR